MDWKAKAREICHDLEIETHEKCDDACAHRDLNVIVLTEELEKAFNMGKRQSDSGHLKIALNLIRAVKCGDMCTEYAANALDYGCVVGKNCDECFPKDESE